MSLKFGIVILAAGATTQSGRPKQLLPYLGRTLIEHAARTALASGASEVIVVVGSDDVLIRQKLRGLAVRIVSNRNWTEGLASSIRCGIGALGPEAECAVIALGDQPKITPELLRTLAKRQIESGCPIVASSYDGVAGAPSAFCAGLFPSLMALQGDLGARYLIRQSAIPVETIEFSGGNVDIEIPLDLKRFIPWETVDSPRDVYREPQDARAPPSRFHLASSPA